MVLALRQEGRGRPHPADAEMGRLARKRGGPSPLYTGIDITHDDRFPGLLDGLTVAPARI